MMKITKLSKIKWINSFGIIVLLLRTFDFDNY